MSADASEWLDLMARAAGATPFQRPEWLLPWCQIFAPERALIMPVRDGDGRLIALLPAVRADTSTLQLAGQGITDYLTPIVDADRRVEACDALRRALDEWSCEFDELPPSSPWIDAVRDAPGWQIEDSCVCPVVSLPTAVQPWMDALPSSLRRNLRRYGQRLADEESASYITLGRDADPILAEEALAALFRTHGRRWHERQQQGVLSESEIRRFHQLSAPALLAADALRLHVLRAGDKIIAVMYVLIDTRRAYAYLAGFDPDWSRFSPGVLLLAYAISQAIEEGRTEFDFLRGAEPYKYTWGAVNSTSARAIRHS
jgi:CelD/BcsL family acetyltransferase involved in cellulose biosynthesis